MQTAMFWIATAFLAAGLFLAPVVGGREPRFQRLGVNVLFGALLVVVAGSLAGEWLAIQQRLPLELVVLVRPPGLRVRRPRPRLADRRSSPGLVVWLRADAAGAVARVRRRDGSRSLVLDVHGRQRRRRPDVRRAASSSPRKTHLTVMEYWRWWVVHLWVEGFFEVFATAAIALIFARLGLVQRSHAGAAVIASSALFLFAGIPGTFHHLYFSGTPTSIMAVGATFSALEVVPLVLIGLEACQTSRMQSRRRRGCSATAGRSASSSASRSGTWSAPACSAS